MAAFISGIDSADRSSRWLFLSSRLPVRRSGLACCSRRPSRASGVPKHAVCCRALAADCRWLATGFLGPERPRSLMTPCCVQRSTQPLGPEGPRCCAARHRWSEDHRCRPGLGRHFAEANRVPSVVRDRAATASGCCTAASPRLCVRRVTRAPRTTRSMRRGAENVAR